YTTPPPIHTLSLYDGLPISPAFVKSERELHDHNRGFTHPEFLVETDALEQRLDDPDLCISTTLRISFPTRRSPTRSCRAGPISRSEEHTSELQSQANLVCRL